MEYGVMGMQDIWAIAWQLDRVIKTIQYDG